MTSPETVASLLNPALSREERLAQVVTLLGQQRADDVLAIAPAPDVDEQLLEEVEELRHRNAVLARALGACPNCWGEHDDCPICRGSGRPGRRRPDPTAFELLIAPAAARAHELARANAAAGRARPSTDRLSHHPWSRAAGPDTEETAT